jgi:flagellar basal-body rod modification protein FlgD
MEGISSAVATNEFLTLLTIQLTNQDPIDPVNQEDFVAQLSQFSMLEQIENLNSTFEQVLRTEQISQGINLVGKNAEFSDPITGEQQTGRVEKLISDDGPVNLVINGQRIAIDIVSGVTA